MYRAWCHDCAIPIHHCLQLQAVEARAQRLNRHPEGLDLHDTLGLRQSNVRLHIDVARHAVVQDLDGGKTRLHVKCGRCGVTVSPTWIMSASDEKRGWEGVVR